MEKIWIKRITEDRPLCRCCHYWRATGVWQFTDTICCLEDIPLCDKCADMNLDAEYDLLNRIIVTPHKEKK